MADRVGDDVCVLLSAHDGGFEPPSFHAAGNGPVSAALADLDGDGRYTVEVVSSLPGPIEIAVTVEGAPLDGRTVTFVAP